MTEQKWYKRETGERVQQTFTGWVEHDPLTFALAACLVIVVLVAISI